jgi:hypothetical protein
VTRRVQVKTFHGTSLGSCTRGESEVEARWVKKMGGREGEVRGGVGGGLLTDAWDRPRAEGRIFCCCPQTE